MQLKVFWIGKTRLPGIAALTEEYSRRLVHYYDFAGEEIRKAPRKGEKKGGLGFTPAEAAILTRSAEAYRVVLDPAGQQWNSARWAQFLGKMRDQEARPVCFCIGDADGFSPQFRETADLLLSLSQLTLPHELARVVLLEQLYRGFTTLAHHPYPR